MHVFLPCYLKKARIPCKLFASVVGITITFLYFKHENCLSSMHFAITMEYYIQVFLDCLFYPLTNVSTGKNISCCNHILLTSIISVLKSDKAALNAFMEGVFAAAFASIINAWACILKTFPNSDKILPTSRSASWLAYSPTTFFRQETEGASGCVATNKTRAGLFERPQSPLWQW